MRERFAILTLADGSFEVLPLELEVSRKEIFFRRKFSVKQGETGKLRRYLKLLFYPRRYELIAGLPAGQAVTIYERTQVPRENPKDKLTAGEADNAISNALWHLYEKVKPKAAQSLRIGEVDLLFRNAAIADFRVNGEPWTKDASLTGREITIELSITFVSREVNAQIESLLPRRAAVSLLGETGCLLSRAADIKVKKFLLAFAGYQTTHLYLRAPEGIAYYDSLPWGMLRLDRALGNAYHLAPQTAQEFLERIARSDASPHALRRLNAALQKDIREFILGLTHAGAGSGAREIILDTPVLCGLQKFPKMIKCLKAEDLVSRPVFRWRERGGMNLLRSRDADAKPSFAAVGMFYEYLNIRRNEAIQRLAKRRMRWLLAQ